ncbi:hypothetical protein OAA07_00360 [bacterium]|nr:hypothetical protein [bacterium]
MPNYTPTEYENILAGIKQTFTSLESDFDTLTTDDELQSYNTEYINQEEELIILQNDLMSDMDTILQAVDRENTKITEYNADNEILNDRYIDIKDKIYGAIGMKNDTQTLYNHEYYGNILIFSSIIGGCLLYARTRNL